MKRCRLQEGIVKRLGGHEASLDVRARLSAVLLELVVRYGDTIVVHVASEELAHLRAASAFQPPSEPPPEPSRATPSRFSLTPTFGRAQGPPAAGRDTPATLLSALASALEAHAGAPFADDLPRSAHDAFISFVNFACKSAPLLEDQIDAHPNRKGWGPPARAAYLAVLRAYACAPEAAFQIISQLVLQAQHDDYEHLSWHDFFRTLVTVHDKYVNVTAESRFAAPEGASFTHSALAM